MYICIYIIYKKTGANFSFTSNGTHLVGKLDKLDNADVYLSTTNKSYNTSTVISSIMLS